MASKRHWMASGREALDLMSLRRPRLSFGTFLSSLGQMKSGCFETMTQQGRQARFFVAKAGHGFSSLRQRCASCLCFQMMRIIRASSRKAGAPLLLFLQMVRALLGNCLRRRLGRVSAEQNVNAIKWHLVHTQEQWSVEELSGKV
jgi:hypothetical protein